MKAYFSGSPTAIEAETLSPVQPLVIDEPYPFISIGDLYEVGSSLAGLSREDAVDLEAGLCRIQRAYAPVNSTHYFIDSSSFSRRLEELAEESASISSAGVVHLDKYIGRDSKNPHFFRLEVSRNKDNQLVSRLGVAASVDEQLSNLVEWAKTNEYHKLTLVDDVLAFGSTLPPLVSQLSESLPGVDIRLLVGLAASGGEWRGLENVQEETGITPQYLIEAHASPAIENGSRGMAVPVSRDLTIFGGKLGVHQDGEQVIYPYFLPFSKPLPSLIEREKRLEASYAYINFNLDMLTKIETTTEAPLLMRDLASFVGGSLFTSLVCLEPRMDLPLENARARDVVLLARDTLSNYEELIVEEIE